MKVIPHKLLSMSALEEDDGDEWADLSDGDDFDFVGDGEGAIVDAEDDWAVI
jgi:hypothetical protein